MIPQLTNTTPSQTLYLTFLQQLKQRGFDGDISPDYANRVVLSTDNSIYQLLPQGVIYPTSAQDLEILTKLARKSEFRSVVFGPRGGGTGTNGQSLTDGLVVDLSKHMNQILEINAEEGWARVQAGVVKDQLNAALEPHGLFFAPELSTSNRATIGGMINTDASGQGSCVYGKTRDHVIELDSVWLDGSCWHSESLSAEELKHVQNRDDRIGAIHRLLDKIHHNNRELITTRFPKLNRCLTGYDLAHIYDEQNRFNLNSVLCGAEGSLAFVTEAKLNVLPIPKYVSLVNLSYNSFDAALRHAQDLMKAHPTSIETVDSKVLGLAKQDIIWDTVREFFPEDAHSDCQGINLVEYTSKSEAELEESLTKLTKQLDSSQGELQKSTGYTIAHGHAKVKAIWAMRKKSVGLLGNAEGSARPVPFVEDTAVPPENLADYIQEFRALLDSHQLSYGMFGHVDAGVLHVRPALDMKNPDDEALVRTVTDGVVALTNKYQGLLWGEHGKGVRSEYSPELFGPELYSCLQQIKAAFDPHNQLNPGKICTPSGSGKELLKIDEVPTRGQNDRSISVPIRQQFDSAMHCNGNSACFNFDPNDAMCPSWKGTRQRIHSPKGRASLTREWLRLLADHNFDTVKETDKIRNRSAFRGLASKVRNTLRKRRGEYDFSHEVHEAMSGCLACKSCVSQCPIKVNVPEFRAQFLELYYGRYLRPLKDYMVGSLEFMLPVVAKWPAPYNWMMSNALAQKIMRRFVGMVDSPTLSEPSLKKGMQLRDIQWATPATLAGLTDSDRRRSVILVQDAFTSYFESKLVLDVIDLLKHLGFHIYVAPFAPNGKPLHVHGFLKTFETLASHNSKTLNALSQRGIPFIGIDPSMTLTYRQEYVKTLGEEHAPEVLLLQEWLSKQQFDKTLSSNHSFKLLAHCTEKTSAAGSIQQWQDIYSTLGLELEVEDVGCCGMAGTYGHETANKDTSKRIYELSWSDVVSKADNQNRLVATGYSCRSQVKRLDEKQLPHPAQMLLSLIKE